MAFLKKLKESLTGKTDLERKQEKAALSQIRKEVTAKRFQAQRSEAIKYAGEVEKEKYKQKLKKLQQPKSNYFSGMGQGMSYGSAFGQPRLASSAPRAKIVSKKSKGKKTKRFNIITGVWE